jgi:fumarate reductase subunit D
MPKKSNEPLLWSLFSAGGVLTAFLMPVHIFLFGIAFPLGWLDAPSYDSLQVLLRLPLTRVYLFLLCFLGLFHWAHRFRFTLNDCLQVKHLNEIIFTFCYGGATAGTIWAGYLLWNIQ